MLKIQLLQNRPNLLSAFRSGVQKGLTAFAGFSCAAIILALLTSSVLAGTYNVGDFRVADMPNGGDRIYTTQQMVSKNGKYALNMQDDGNLVLYQNVRLDRSRVCWATNTAGRGGQYVQIQTDGNLVLRGGANGVQPIWASNFVQPASASNTYNLFYISMQDDGNVVVYRDQKVYYSTFQQRTVTAVWATNTQYCGQR